MRALALGLLLVVGCAERVEPPALDVQGSPAPRWEQVVLRATRQGGVDWAIIQEERQTLDEVLAWYAKSGPESRRIPESREDERLSSMLNMHNALVVDLVLRFVLSEGADPSLLRVPRALREDRAFRVDNEWITLERLRTHRVVSVFQEPEVAGALWLGTADGPRLRWWRPEYLRAVLKLGLYDWLMRDGGLRREGEGWAVNADLYDYRKDFRDFYGAANLCIALQEYVAGPARRWMLDHLDDCPLGSFTPEDRLDGPARAGQAIR